MYQNTKDWWVYRTSFSGLDAMPVLQNVILEPCDFAMNEWMQRIPASSLWKERSGQWNQREPGIIYRGKGRQTDKKQRKSELYTKIESNIPD